MQCTIVNGSSLKKKRHKIHWGPCCHRNQCYSLLLIINGGFCYHSLLQTSLFPALCCRMQHPLPIHKYFMTTGCCVSSLWITLGLSHPLPNSCCPVRERLQFLHFFISLHASVWKVFTVPQNCGFHGGFALGSCTSVSWACLALLKAEPPFSGDVTLLRLVGTLAWKLRSAECCLSLESLTIKWRCHISAGHERGCGPHHTKVISSASASTVGGHDALFPQISCFSLSRMIPTFLN